MTQYNFEALKSFSKELLLDGIVILRPEYLFLENLFF